MHYIIASATKYNTIAIRIEKTSSVYRLFVIETKLLLTGDTKTRFKCKSRSRSMTLRGVIEYF